MLDLLFVNGPQALYVNPYLITICKYGYLKCISGMNLYAANRNLLIMLFIVLRVEKKYHLIIESY